MRVVEAPWMNVDLPGVTIDGWDFTGTMFVRAPDITIRNSHIRPTPGSGIAPIIVHAGGFLLFDPPTCMDCGTIGTWHPDSIRVATVDGTDDVSEGNLATLCQTCMGRARGAVERHQGAT